MNEPHYSNFVIERFGKSLVRLRVFFFFFLREWASPLCSSGKSNSSKNLDRPPQGNVCCTHDTNNGTKNDSFDKNIPNFGCEVVRGLFYTEQLKIHQSRAHQAWHHEEAIVYAITAPIVVLLIFIVWKGNTLWSLPKRRYGCVWVSGYILSLYCFGCYFSITISDMPLCSLSGIWYKNHSDLNMSPSSGWRSKLDVIIVKLSSQVSVSSFPLSPNTLWR